MVNYRLDSRLSHDHQSDTCIHFHGDERCIYKKPPHDTVCAIRKRTRCLRISYELMMLQMRDVPSQIAIKHAPSTSLPTSTPCPMPPLDMLAMKSAQTVCRHHSVMSIRMY
jgi:hypothetical protein